MKERWKIRWYKFWCPDWWRPDFQGCVTKAWSFREILPRHWWCKNCPLLGMNGATLAYRRTIEKSKKKQIDKNHWYYEDKRGIEIYEERNVGEIPNNFVCRIPWRSIKASFKRYLATKKQD